MPSRSQYQDPNYVPVDLVEFLNEEEEEEERRQQYQRDEPQRREEQIEAAAYDHYLYFRDTHGLSHARAALAADYHPDTVIAKFIDSMPAAKKTTTKSGTKVTKPSYPKKKTTTTTSKVVDINKLVKAATEKALSRNIETQHSYARFELADRHVDAIQQDGTTKTITSYTADGVSLSPLNMGEDLQFHGTNVLAFNLSALSQVRGSTSSGAASGWRNGYKIHAMSLSIDVRIVMPNPSVDAKWYLWVCRKKDGIRTDYHTPGIDQIEATQLFRKKNGGPFGNAALEPEFFTLSKKNTEVWSWPEGMRDEKSITAVTRANTGRVLNMHINKKLDTVWEFSSDVASATPALKDGDYNMFLFREGPDDPTSLKTHIVVSMDLAFKDC
jgi:hypothetical protein